MSVLIKGMEMPKSCDVCQFNMFKICYINTLQEGKYTVTHSCPLVPVPEHGDLISRDALRHWILTEMASLDTKEDREFVADRLANELPTIISADKEGEG